MKILAIIPAKGNSKRLPRKNIYSVNGMPMIYWAIKACGDSAYDIDVWVNTDDEEVANIVREHGAKVHYRDDHLKDPDLYKQNIIMSTAEYVIKHHYTPDIVISLQANSPEIKGEHLDKGINTLIKNKKHEIFSVDNNLMQNSAFRIMKGDYVFQQGLSTYCGVVICDLIDVHTKEDLKELKWK